IVYPILSLRRSSKRGVGSARVDTATAHRTCVPLDLHHLGIYVLGDSFRYRNIPSLSNGRNSFSDCGRSALRLDAFERSTASNTGQLESRDHRRGITLARWKRWGDEGRIGDSFQLGCGVDHNCSNLDGSFGAVAKGPHRPNSARRYRPSLGLRRGYSAGRTWRPRWQWWIEPSVGWSSDIRRALM